ncbi:MAG: hypothetical protein Q8941_07200 [Bacteroidota bacterium]|nr:hypothetical protein [Bacteroidota bacterium]
MCFSATASFGAGIVLAVIGVATLKKANHPVQIFFAVIPLLFCVQQITEGFLWLALSNRAYASTQQPATYTFLFIAQVVWPVYVPLSISLLEKKESRKKIQKIFVATGALVSLYLVFCLFSYPVEAKIIGYHISYEQKYPAAIGNYAGLLYIIATIAPPFFSGIKRMWVLGTAVLISYIMTTIFYNDYIVSVWCFFASIISVSVFAIMQDFKKPNKVPAIRNVPA